VRMASCGRRERFFFSKIRSRGTLARSPNEAVTRSSIANAAN
jgi:hypothetical protein